MLHFFRKFAPRLGVLCRRKTTFGSDFHTPCPTNTASTLPFCTKKQPFDASGANFRNYLHNASSANNLHYYIYVVSWCEVWEHTTGRGADFVYISAFKCEVKEHFSTFLHPQQPLGANFTNIFRVFLVSCNENGLQKQISFPKSAPCGDSTRVPVRTLGTFSCPSDGFCCKICFSKLKNGAKKMRSFHYKRDDLRKIRTFRTNFCT